MSVGTRVNRRVTRLAVGRHLPRRTVRLRLTRRELIANLIDNAIRHNTAGGRVELTTGSRDGKALLAVANSGPAVPPQEIERLFQPFQRLGGARTRHTNGHGLGLSIVQAIAAAHRAQLVTRARPEGGLSIEVSFPPTSGASASPVLSPPRSRERGGAQPRPRSAVWDLPDRG